MVRQMQLTSVQLEPENSKLKSVLDMLRGFYVNGGVIFATFDSSDDLLPNSNPQADLLDFLDSPDLRRSLHYLEIPTSLHPLPTHTMISIELLEADIASLLKSGGAYTDGYADDPRRIAQAFRAALAVDRNDTRIFRIEGAWTRWFYDVAWDYSTVIHSRKKNRWTIFCCTDTD